MLKGLKDDCLKENKLKEEEIKLLNLNLKNQNAENVYLQKQNFILNDLLLNCRNLINELENKNLLLFNQDKALLNLNNKEDDNSDNKEIYLYSYLNQYFEKAEEILLNKESEKNENLDFSKIQSFKQEVLIFYFLLFYLFIIRSIL